MISATGAVSAARAPPSVVKRPKARTGSPRIARTCGMVDLPLAVDSRSRGIVAPKEARFVAVTPRVIDGVDHVEEASVGRIGLPADRHHDSGPLELEEPPFARRS